MKLLEYLPLRLNKVIHYIKDDPVLYMSGEYLSIFSKYPYKGPPIVLPRYSKSNLEKLSDLFGVSLQ